MLERLNFIILLLAVIASWGCLWTASHESWPFALLAAWLFSMVTMLPFSLLHESTHGTGSPSPKKNYILGLLSGMVFGTSVSMQTVAHLGHHKRNRTDDDLYDYYLPNESKLLRNFWMYAGNLLGAYWFCIPISNALYFLAPWIYKSQLFVTKISPALGFGPYVEELARLPIRTVWSEIALVFIYHLAVFILLDLTWHGWLLCYWFFALHWSALQYADHAWSARDIMNGAWNLKVSAPARWLALNYHYHLAHHQHPSIPWNELPEYVDKKLPQPTFWAIYLSMWKGVRPAPPMGSPANFELFSSEEKPG